MDALVQDVRYAARGLLRSPGFAALTVLCLALGIGVNSTVFSLADNVSLRPLPFEEPDRLVGALFHTALAPASTQQGLVSRTFATGRSRRAASPTSPPIPIGACRSPKASSPSGSRGRPSRGTSFRSSACSRSSAGTSLRTTIVPARAPVVMLSHGLWQRRYAGDPSIVGRELVVNGAAHTVIGVMPPRFQFPQVAQLWVPVVPLEYACLAPRPHAAPVCAAGSRAHRSRRPAANLAEVAGQLARVHREDDGWSARAVSLRDELMPIVAASRDHGDDGRRVVGAHHRLRQRRQPAAGARDRPAARDRRPDGARRRPLAAGPSVAHRERAPRRC